MKKLTTLALLLVSLPLGAETPAPPQPSSAAMTGLRPIYGRVKDLIVRAAEKMPEENYGFKPTPEVKTFAQFVGHLADSQNMFCAMALGEKPPASELEKTATTKAELVKGLKESMVRCDKAFAQDDPELSRSLNLFGRETNRYAAIGLAIAHGFEHYGNMVTYMRIKGLVPPSSEAPPQPVKAESEKTKAAPAPATVGG